MWLEAVFGGADGGMESWTSGHRMALAWWSKITDPLRPSSILGSNEKEVLNVDLL